LRRVKRLVVALALLIAGPAGAQTAPLQMTASKPKAGHIALALTGPPAAQVDVREGSRPVAIVTLDAQGRGRVADAGTWNCRARHRTFTATSATLEATATTTTPSCTHRYAVTVRPRHPRSDRRVRVRARDRFQLVRPRVCVDRHCHRGTLRTRLEAGRYRIHVADRTLRPLRVRPPKHVRLLATGDSTIQIVDSFLEQQLPRDRVRSDAKISSGLSKPQFFDWPQHARSQVASFHPDVTLLSIGVNDGYPFGSVACCGKAWRRRYASVVVRMTRTYARTGQVFWCLQPAPRPANFRRVLAAVNAGLRIAARRDERVRLVDLSRRFTPGFHFRQYVDGVSVRADDGIHFNVSGARMAARFMIRRMARSGAL
jgi:hypothetical protein